MIFNKLLTDSKDVVILVMNSIDRKQPLLLSYFNQHCFNIYCSDNHYREILDGKFELYQADLGIFLALKFLFNKKLNRIDATRMNQIIIDELIRKKITITIVGSKFDKNFLVAETNKRGINLVGYYDGFFQSYKTESLIRELSSLNNQVYIIGMGVPKQELFAEKLVQINKSGIIICVGNFLEFYFGTKKRAPVFIQKIGFEWIFRIITEPKRLWKRYVIGIPIFILRVLKIKLFKNNS